MGFFREFIYQQHIIKQRGKKYHTPDGKKFDSLLGAQATIGSKLIKPQNIFLRNPKGSVHDNKLLRNAIIKELDAINDYEDDIVNLGSKEAVSVISHINKEEKEHVEELSGVLKKLRGNPMTSSYPGSAYWNRHVLGPAKRTVSKYPMGSEKREAAIRTLQGLYAATPRVYEKEDARWKKRGREYGLMEPNPHTVAHDGDLRVEWMDRTPYNVGRNLYVVMDKDLFPVHKGAFATREEAIRYMNYENDIRSGKARRRSLHNPHSNPSLISGTQSGDETHLPNGYIIIPQFSWHNKSGKVWNLYDYQRKFVESFSSMKAAMYGAAQYGLGLRNPRYRSRRNPGGLRWEHEPKYDTERTGQGLPEYQLLPYQRGYDKRGHKYLDRTFVGRSEHPIPFRKCPRDGGAMFLQKHGDDPKNWDWHCASCGYVPGRRAPSIKEQAETSGYNSPEDIEKRERRSVNKLLLGKKGFERIELQAKIDAARQKGWTTLEYKDHLDALRAPEPKQSELKGGPFPTTRFMPNPRRSKVKRHYTGLDLIRIGIYP